jgi:hypothetical protein
MTQITDNATFAAWLRQRHKETKRHKYLIINEVANIFKPAKSPVTVNHWYLGTKPLTAGNAALINAAIERGEI